MDKKTGLELLREPFPENQISKLPKGTKAQNECPAADKINCKICGGWHHPKVIHLDYVGHAALTDRLLDVDSEWFWEPMALKEGLPAFDAIGGLWIRLTICGMSRIGYGNAAAMGFRTVGDREKEVIGDALRNAAMRFGAALDLWHKGDLHIEDAEPLSATPTPPPDAPEPPQMLIPGSLLHKQIEAKIGEANIDRELFKNWLLDKGKIGFLDGKPSFKAMTEVDAQKMVDVWDATLKAFERWILKRRERKGV